MFNHLRKFLIVNLALVLALLGSLAFQSSAQAQFVHWFPDLIVTPNVGSTTGYIGVPLTFQAEIENDGNVALQIDAYLEPPLGWDVSTQSGDCAEYLGVNAACTITWVFIPQVTGDAYVRVYARGLYTDSNGDPQHVTRSAAILFTIYRSGQVQTPVSGRTSPAVGPVIPAVFYPDAIVTPHVGNAYSSATGFVGKQLNFQATVYNNGSVPLQIEASLSPTIGWELLNQSSDCPTNLVMGGTCTLTWEFIPRINGLGFVRVYVRGFYTDLFGFSQRITKSPGFFIDVLP